MKKFNTILVGMFVAAIFFTACKNEDQTPAIPSQGTADFSRYIAIGNSLTSGYADGGLFRAAQQNSFPSMIAQQMKLAGGGNFTQPLFSEAESNGSGYLKYGGLSSTGSPNLIPVTTKLAVRGVAAIPGFGNVTLYTKYSGENNNYGVPGIKLLHISYAPYGNLNGYFERLLPGVAGTNSTTYLDFVTANPFTFFTNWLGNNDALGYATSGGVGDVLTPKDQFLALYTSLINKLTVSGAKGAVATIPDVTSTAYLNTVKVADLLAAVKKVNSAVTAIYIETAAGPRAATSEDLVNLTFPTSMLGVPNSSSIPYGLHPLNPIESKYVLDKTESTLAKDYIVYYNSVIKSVAESKGLAVFDAYTFFNEGKSGFIYDGVSLNSSYISGKVFSLDGVHLTPMGYAVAANEFIKAINAKYGSTLTPVSLGNYTFLRFN